MDPRLQKVIHAEALYNKRVRTARDELATFIETCARNEAGHHINLHQMHLAWIWHVDYCWSRGLRAMILSPFESGKSSTLAVPLAAWLVGKNPQARLKFVCNTDDSAILRVGATKVVMETPDYQAVFPGVRRGLKWSSREVFVDRRGGSIDPTLHARGVKSTGVGGRADYIIFDDVNDQKNTESEAQRKLIKGLVRSTWLSRLDQPTGRALWIATPWHFDDSTHDLWHDPLWCTLVVRVRPPDFEHYELEVFNAGEDYLAGGVAAGLMTA